jgi:hypothetical protein
MKPFSATEILRRNAPRDLLGRSFVHANRYDPIREPSPVPSFRSRAGSNISVKRKEDDSCDYVEQAPSKKGKIVEMDDIAIACMESNIEKVSKLCDKITMDIQESDHVSDSSKAILSDMCEAIRTLKNVQSELVSKISAQAATEQVDINIDNAGKISYSSVARNESHLKLPIPTHSRRLPQGGLVQLTLDKTGKQIGKSSNSEKEKPAETPEETKTRKFAEAIREAERSSLCFNLNMGNVPLQNKGTIQEKAALALTSMAASKENRNSSVPSNDAIVALDDFSSMVTNMEFFGANTKQYKGKTDTPFCTVPVKYQFKDRDTRVFAEKTLRDTCGVHCATPYPLVVREAIKKIVEKVKKDYPEDFVKVNVMVKEFSLKVARRPKGKDLEWHYYPDLIPLPEQAKDISLRKLPDNVEYGVPDRFDPEMEVSTPTSPAKVTPISGGLSSVLKVKK